MGEARRKKMKRLRVLLLILCPVAIVGLSIQITANLVYGQDTSEVLWNAASLVIAVFAFFVAISRRMEPKLPAQGERRRR